MSNDICWDCANCYDEYDDTTGKTKFSCMLEEDKQKQKEFPFVRANRDCFKRFKSWVSEKEVI